MEKAGVTNTLYTVVRDESYMCPSLNFVRGAFSNGFRSYMAAMGMNDYILNENDCDKYSNAAVHYMNFLHHQTSDKKRGTGIAIGIFDYIRGKDVTFNEFGSPLTVNAGHSINVIILRHNNEIKVVFYEPQTYSIVELTPAEIWSCTRWYF
jgi:hypothetical protein